MKSYLEVPGSSIHELPTLSVHGINLDKMDQVIKIASSVIVNERLINSLLLEELAPPVDIESWKIGKAFNIARAYLDLLLEWRWGNGILQWTRKCKMALEARPELRDLLQEDLWPHSGRASFVTLLEDKEAIQPHGIGAEQAVGLRLSFLQPPPVACCTSQFLRYKEDIGAGTYQAWAGMQPAPVSALPPDRFHFQVVVL